MQIRNNIIILFLFFSSFFNLNLNAEEFDISASEITIDQKNNIVTGKGAVEIIDSEGKIIKSEKVIYEKSKEFLTVEGSVEILDTEGNILKTDKAEYDKIKETIVSFENTELKIKEGYQLKSSNVIYNNIKKIISSNNNSVLTDSDGNIVSINMFQYQIKENLFSSVGEIKIVDINKNKYFFKELHVDTKKKEMIGSDVSVILDQSNFGLSKDNDPRLVANSIFMSKNKSDLSKGVFTVCKQRNEKCPPWSIKAKKITHDKVKKTIYYDHATLKVYDIPIFYFPKFSHPDPSVKRQSGFLPPFFTSTTSLGAGFGLPYYWAISHDKDLTFTPKLYSQESILFLNEYRQAFSKGFLALDTSYTQGYKNTSETKTKGSRNHIFAELDFDFGQFKSYESSLSFKTQRVSNDSFFRIHNINTSLVNSENTDLKNEINYNFAKNNMYVNISGTVYENLREESNSRYEYILPNVLYGKTFLTEKFGLLDFKSNIFYKNYDVNKHRTVLNNDIIWSPSSFITKNGFVNTLSGMVTNSNYEAKNTADYKNQGTINELSGVLRFKSSFPLKKETENYSNIFSPNFMVRYAPGHMIDLGDEDVNLKYSNLYSLNKTSVIEDGLNTILGFDFKVREKDVDGTNREKLSLSMGQAFSPQKNKDIPSSSSLDQKISDLVGEINYNFSEIGNIDYKFSVDHNFNDINYSNVSTNLNFGKVAFNIDYLEEQNHVGNEHYINSGISLNFNSNNSLSFETKKNFKTDSTELYDINYEYMNDCLTAGLVFRREFYQDNDVDQKDSVMFVIKFVPFGGVTTPALQP